VPPRGSAIGIIFKLGGGCYRTHRQHPQGARHLCRLQPWWWKLPNLLAAPPGGPPLTSSSKLGGGCCWTHRQRPRGPAIDVILKTRLWTLPDPLIAPPGALPSMSYSKLGDERCRTHRQRPPWGHHRRLEATGSHCQYQLPTLPRGPLVDYHN
jgi:hypothetical protein